jgi:hypothetical protein
MPVIRPAPGEAIRTSSGTWRPPWRPACAPTAAPCRKASAAAGTCEEALAIGFFAASRSQDFREVMAIAANHDGQSDVTAGIAGQLFAAQRGMEALPHAWIRCLDVRDALFDVADWSLPLWLRAAARRGD